MATPFVRRQQLHVLDIGNLADILDLLRRHGYSGTSYYNLGLYLGLLTRTLDVIKDNNRGDVSSGLTECLKTWLQQANDVHMCAGGPTYHSLIQALRKIGENAVANGIDGDKHPACAIFTQCGSNESVVAAIPSLVKILYKEKIIDEMLVPTIGEVLIEAVKKSVCSDYHNLKKFATILMRLNSQSVTPVAVSMLNDYSKAFPEDYVKIISKERNEHVNISLPLKLSPEFTKIRTMFTDLIDDVAKAMKNSVRYENLKRYIGRNENLRPHLAHCQNIDEIIELIGDHCSLINVALLEGVVKKFKVKEAEAAIQKYKNEVESFHEEGRPLRQFLDQYLAPASSLQCETATILVRKEVDDFEVKDINVLMIVAFETLAPNIQVHVIKEDKSFTITCSFPVLLSESLIATALDNIESLIEIGVEKLTIGYSTIYDHDKVFKYDEFQHDEAVTLKNYTVTSELKQQLYASVYDTTEQLLISRTIQLLNSKEELASVQQLKNENEKPEAEVKVMKLEVSQSKTKDIIEEEKRYKSSPLNDTSYCYFLVIICILIAIVAIFIALLWNYQKELYQTMDDCKEKNVALNLNYTKCDFERSTHIESKEEKSKCLDENGELKKLIDKINGDKAHLDKEHEVCKAKRKDFEQCEVDKRELDDDKKKLEADLKDLNKAANSLNLTCHKEMEDCKRYRDDAMVNKKQYEACLKDKDSINTKNDAKLAQCQTNLGKAIDTSRECQERLASCR